MKKDVLKKKVLLTAAKLVEESNKNIITSTVIRNIVVLVEHFWGQAQDFSVQRFILVQLI